MRLTPGTTRQLRQFSRDLEPRLDILEKRLQRRLQQEGFEKIHRETIALVTPFAAARLLLARKPLTYFLQQVDTAGRQLANLKITPDRVMRALGIGDEIIGTETAGYQGSLEKLGFETILAINKAFYEIREAESHAFYNLCLLELESSNTDVLSRRFLENMAQTCGAGAAHYFLLAEDGRSWRLQASTARAASPETLALLSAPDSVRRALEKPARITREKLVLDKGWSKYPCVWSIPVKGGVLQFAFSRERNLLPREIELLMAAGERCQAATQKTRLIEEIATSEGQLRKLVSRMLIVEENERRRISRELHDDAGQSLVVIRLQMEMIEQSLQPETEARERLAEARDLTEKTILDIRRLISDLSPAVLQHMGLGAALRQLVHRFRDRYPSDVRLNVGQLPALDTNFQLVIYRLAQECFNNIAQHSKATAINITLSAADRVLRLQVEDDGLGFHVDEALSRKDCFGLAGILERVAILGGQVSIQSTPRQGLKGNRKKTGTAVKIELPIA